MKIISAFVAGLCGMLLASSANAELSITDDVGRVITLPEPAQRIISLAPHITENVFSAGAGDKLVGVVEYSNYPVAAQSLPKVGSYTGFNLESIIARKPDIIIAWQSGNALHKIQPLINLGYQVYITQPFRLEDIAKQIRDIGRLAGTVG